jgi:ectoine hydroxylase-related dioxygenase (phytanoyl-CoA dioxygenase family)
VTRPAPQPATPDYEAVGIFSANRLDECATFFLDHGYATLRGLFEPTVLAAAEAELVEAQQRLADGNLDRHFATSILDEPDAVIDGCPFAHYVCFATRVSARADALVCHPALVAMTGRLLGPEAWLLDYEQFGVVYQDARPGPTSGYSRIGWHTDHQSGPHLGIWPGVAFTIHFDPTSPANGFLRVLPKSHLHGDDGIPLGFERVPGEIAVYQERGDVLFHHADLWHAAARATADGEDAIRRHLRGSWHGGVRLEVGHGTDDFVKNALR